jgi:hypothetical protein
MRHRCIVKDMALNFLMGLIVCVWLDSDARAQGGRIIQNPPCCSLSIADDVGFNLRPISVTNPPRFITCPKTNPPVAAWCTKSKDPFTKNMPPCGIYGASPALGDVRYDCTALTTLDFCDGKFAGVELKKGDGTWGFCAPDAGSEKDVSARAESPILGFGEGEFYRFSCQPDAAEHSDCSYVSDTKKTRYPYLAVKEGDVGVKSGECVTRPGLVCTAVMGHGKRWKDPMCRSMHGARNPPPWNSADLGQYRGPVQIGTAATHRDLYYSHTGMPAPVKVCMPKSAGGTGGGGTGGSTGGGNGGSPGRGGGGSCAVDKCGDGICQAVVCMACGCPKPESATSCPSDCGGTGGSTGGSGTGGGAGSGGSGRGGGNGGGEGRVCPQIACPPPGMDYQTCKCLPPSNGGSNGGGPSAGGGANGNNGTGGGGITSVIIPPPQGPLDRLSGRGQGFSGSGAPPAVSGGMPAGAGGFPAAGR